MKCEHPVMARNAICQAPARFTIQVAGSPATLNVCGARVTAVCRRHANVLAISRPGAVLVEIQ